MTEFVLDTSVCMRWLFPTEKKSDQRYAEAVLSSVNTHQVVVPNLWQLEVANVLVNAVRKSGLDLTKASSFIQKLGQLPITTDSATYSNAFSSTFHLAVTHKLSSYHAAYLELASRKNVPLATLDKDLIKACDSHGIQVYPA